MKRNVLVVFALSCLIFTGEESAFAQQYQRPQSPQLQSPQTQQLQRSQSRRIQRPQSPQFQLQYQAPSQHFQRVPPRARQPDPRAQFALPEGIPKNYRSNVLNAGRSPSRPTPQPNGATGTKDLRLLPELQIAPVFPDLGPADPFAGTPTWPGQQGTIPASSSSPMCDIIPMPPEPACEDRYRTCVTMVRCQTLASGEQEFVKGIGQCNAGDRRCRSAE